ncbi:MULTISPECIES: response regulator [Photobacterium]|uniref:Chemotaxis protein CheY n=1 Tax=Photobacterium ganghwense TaxID=320778 RepID=A0A0J1KAW0_9GAMM|nr:MULTISPECIES: response regulator [Photobacterium]KLV11457.1 chemotaxis protein CheY [Photobacterium ganghwense]PSU08311.1 response regulator [Photobacterium ganghwense]QSV15118.1 response regulator [Photobacterium ganghwense]
MNKYLILCVDDEREVLDSVLHDLSDLEDHFVLEAAESVDEAKEVIAESIADHIPLALILCDHIMPGETGIDFLIELTHQEENNDARKVLLTGQAGLEETVQAVNNASLDYYIAKPWNGDALKQVVIDQLTTYVIEHEKDLMPWIQVLDTQRVMQALSDRRLSLSDN